MQRTSQGNEGSEKWYSTSVVSSDANRVALLAAVGPSERLDLEHILCVGLQTSYLHLIIRHSRKDCVRFRIVDVKPLNTKGV